MTEKTLFDFEEDWKAYSAHVEANTPVHPRACMVCIAWDAGWKNFCQDCPECLMVQEMYENKQFPLRVFCSKGKCVK